ncbi:hypothetical protein VTL71DRAFT_6610 [Oculimacula yallundae]|uniref:Uncharacterized protein n=1 Tax=Oculimacula yallundae TaxID=86028 RepID=A0ABR4BZ54_9HELO
MIQHGPIDGVSGRSYPLPKQPNKSLLLNDDLEPSDFRRELLILHKRKELDDSPNLEILLTDIYLFMILELLGQKNAAWLKLQEVITMSEILNLFSPSESYAVGSAEWEKRNRLYLFLMIGERSYTFGKWYRLTVPTVPKHLLRGFSQLQHLGDITTKKSENRNISVLHLLSESFSCLEPDLVECWDNKCLDIEPCKKLRSERVLSLIRKVPNPDHKHWKQLVLQNTEHAHREAELPMPPEGVQNQQGDVLLTCLWVSSRLWRIAFHHGHVSNKNVASELRSAYLFNLAQTTLDTIKSFTIRSLETHSKGLGEKIFEIASVFVHVAFTWEPDAEEDWRPNSHVHSTQEQHNTEVAREVFDVSIGDRSVTLDSQNSGSIGSITTSNPSRISRFDIANGFLGFFALFQNGKSGYLEPHMDLCKRHVYTAER